jgi:hypothetical protein
VDSAPEIPFIFDSDALIQIFIAGQQQILSTLATDFGVRAYLMNEVDTEVRSNKKFGSLVKPKLDKALKSQSLKLLTASDLDRLSGVFGTPISLSDIRELGKEYALDVGIGEAHTHAAGVLLKTPTVSNDMNAIKTLEVQCKDLPPTILRSFDLFGFMFFENYVSIHDSEQILKELKSQAEWMPSPLRHSSFELGIKNIGCRLSTSLGVSAGPSGWSSPFFLKRVT